MRLYGSTRSPFARKAAIVAHEAGLWPRIEFIEIEVPGAPNLEHRAANPLAKLPTLLTDDGAAVLDSAVICEYFAALGAPALVPEQGPARWRALTRQALADGLLDLLLQWRAELRRPEAARQEQLIAAWAQRRDATLDRLDGEAASAPTLDIGDIAVAVLLDYLGFRFPEFDWRRTRTGLSRWRDRVVARPSFQATEFCEPWTGA